MNALSRHMKPLLAAGLCLILLPPPLQAEPQRYALVAGVKNYPASSISLPSLAYTEADANEMAGILKAGGYQVTLMTQSAASTAEKQGFSPNAAFLRHQFKLLVKTPNLKKNDCLLVMLGGHGIQLPSKTNPEAETHYFCPADARIDDLTFSEDVQPEHNLISVQELYDTLKSSQAGVKLLIVDACRNNPRQTALFREAKSVTRPPFPTPPGGMAAMFSCSPSELAAEDPDLKHGVFSYYLLEGLRGPADTKGNDDGLIDLNELYQYASQATYNYVRKKHSRQQLPELKGEIRGWAPLLDLKESGGSPGDGGKPDPDPDPELVLSRPEEARANTLAAVRWENNSLKMKFRWCPPGDFLMGSPAHEGYRQSNETQTQAKIRQGFWLGQYEVTQAEWEQLTGRSIREQQQMNRKALPLGDIGPDFPVYYITWTEAVEFCRLLTERERTAGNIPSDWEFVLPTEAMWEYACRAGTSTPFSFGDNPQGTDLGNYAWWGKDDSLGNARLEKYPHQVGLKKPNPWNLSDMHGNVWEWCRDQYIHEHPGGTDPVVLGGNAWPDRVIRGGSYFSGVRELRSAHRGRVAPAASWADVGLRVALVKSAD